MEYVQRRIDELVPYDKNAKKHDKKQIAAVAESIKRYGFVQPVVVDKDGVIVIGHCRTLAAKKLGMETVPCVSVEDLSPEEVNALRLVDNKTNESAWDLDLLAESMKLADLDGFDLDWGNILQKNDSNPYTDVVKIPQYEITGERPEWVDIYDISKQTELIEEIKQSCVSEEEKRFLVQAAHRHCRINYKNVAEYYAHASPEMQRLMEKQALVIIDLDDAIANGYVKLSKIIERIRNG